MAGKADRIFMRRALELAARARGKTSPNPMVGAVVVKDGVVVGEGYHHAAGLPHAEINAIRNAGGKARGGSIYVTLEPCCHNGRTGPCTDAIIAAGIKRVVYAVTDPDRRVSGGGARQLRRAGLTVSSGLLRGEARRLNDQYFGFKENQRTYVIVKTAQSLDGRIATRTGDSQWISCPESLRLAHRLRGQVDGVVVGGGTLLADNPALTVRLIKARNPYRIVLSAKPRFPRNCNLLNQNDDYRTIIATSRESVRELARSRRTKSVILWTIKQKRDGRLDLNDFLSKAGQFGLQSVLVEGGPTLATSFFKSELVDKYMLISAPIMIGTGRDSIGELGIKRLAKAVRFEDTSFEWVGVDSLFVGYPKWGRG